MESRLAARKNRRARKEICDYVTVDYRRMKNLRPDYTAEVPMPVPPVNFHAPKLFDLSGLVPDPDLAMLIAQVPAEEAIPSGDIVVEKDVNLGFVANDL